MRRLVYQRLEWLFGHGCALMGHPRWFCDGLYSRFVFRHWDDIDIHYHGQVLSSTGHGFSGLSRRAMLEILAEPGRFMVATAATLVSEIIGKARRDGKVFYHINDGVYHTFSGVVYDHWIPNFHAFKEGEPEICAVVGPTCDSFDKISLSAQLPGNLEIGDYLLTENIGAYSTASSTNFNGFDGARIIHTNLRC